MLMLAGLDAKPFATAGRLLSRTADERGRRRALLGNWRLAKPDLRLFRVTIRCGVLGETEVTNGEQRMLSRGVAAGTLMGVAIGLMIAFFIMAKPDFFAAFVR